MEDLYNQKITEFTDWISGTNSLTGGNDTMDDKGVPLKVSGERIRELLQNRLREPIYLWRDSTENLYRIFSSIEAWRIWDSDRNKYKNLELANFVAPSDYGIQVTIEGENTVLYTREGVHDASSTISYSWKVVDGKGNELNENMYITYNIIENGKSYPTTKTANQKNVREDLYEWLSPGTNTLEISFKGADSGATIKKTLTIHVLKLDINTDFDWKVVQRNLYPLSFSLYADRNIRGPLSFKTCRYYYGSGEFNKNVLETYENTFNIKTSDENNFNPSVEYREFGTEDKTQLKAGLHSIQVLGRMVLNNQEFDSNLLYYIFGVGYPAGGELMYHGISVKCSFNNKTDFIDPASFTLRATQYKPFTLNWGYISYIGGNTKNVSWYLRNTNESDSSDYTETFINSFECSSNVEATPLQYIPTESTRIGWNNYLVAKIGESELIKLPIYIVESELGISETGGTDLKLKLSAYGKQNSNIDNVKWEYDGHGTVFSGIKWNDASGWYENSFRVQGENSYARIDYNPFGEIDAENKGATIEIEFESEYISSTDDELIRLGGSGDSEPHISIYANKAQLFIQGNPIITTNYKANERVKLAFIIEPSKNDSINNELKSIVFIVNNGIVERAAGWRNYNANVFNSNTGSIIIGNCNSGVRVYNIRCYTTAITIVNAYNNYVYDSDNKAQIVANNNIYDENGNINLGKCQNKLDVIIIKGSLDKILNRGTSKDASNSACSIQRICTKDHSKDFILTHGRIRKHGQSTLNYPLTSYKLWTWSSVDEVRPNLIVGASSDLAFTKNRYQMKDNAIPSNKFVLQANYADSSGTHNGGILRLIQDIWYKAQIDGEYKLRTQPQLFASNQTISPQEGDVMTEEEERLFCGMNSDGKQWKDYFPSNDFPYTLRVAPDSFPCLVFYQNEDKGDEVPQFLGQYVFMDDKKADYIYGQRSIYKVENVQSGANNSNDPFCVKRDPQTGESLWDEDNGIKIWDNDKVLRIECLSVNSTLADFRGVIADNSKRRFDNIIYGENEDSTSIGWEEDFELVYPEKEEITTSKKFDSRKFVNTVNPFTEWLRWLIGTYQNQKTFQDTAAQHLDLYKMAAYYIFVLRFGLVDSLERNAQIKTYDGKHFHYEPWDMDIALGNRNTGGIAFDPPIDRNTMMDATTGAISGKSWDTTNEKFVSNWLFDALENWPKWINEIVPKVADAMFKQGLTYQNVISMLDGNYQNAWCESIYNESGIYKYVVNRQNMDGNGNILPGYDDSWLSWLQGARTTHRHWWLKSSMDYYDAKWSVGEFMQKNMYIGCEMHNVNGSIRIDPTSNTFFMFEREADKYGPFEVSPTQPLDFNVSAINSGAKVPFKLYGANFIKAIDLSDIASGLQVFSITNAYSPEVGPVISKVNIGVKFTEESVNTFVGQENNKNLQIAAGNALNALEELNIRGQHGKIEGLEFLSDTKTIKKIYALGSGMETLNSAVGTDFEVLELPDTLTSITFNSTTWNPQNLSFWNTKSGKQTTISYTDYAVDEQGNVIYENGEPVYQEYQIIEMEPATYTKFNLNDSNIITSIPRGLKSVKFTGTTGKNACSRQFVVDWINSIIKWGTEDWNNFDETQKAQLDNINTLEEYIDSLFKDRSLSIENINWNDNQIPGLSYQQLEYISKFNNIDYSEEYTIHPNVKNFANGYVVLTDTNILNSIQISNLSNWFGEGVFVLNSNGLVVDQKIDYTAISVGPSAFVQNGEIYIREGNSARIQATKFRLKPSLDETDFSLATPGSSISATSYEYPVGSGNIAANIASNTVGEDTIYYLRTFPNSTGQNYDVKLISGSGDVIIHVLALEYPEQVFLSINGNKKETDSGKLSDFYRYNKSFNAFILGQSSGSFLVGVQFKERGTYRISPEDEKLKPEYVRFKVYVEGVLSPKFQEAKEYTDFIQNENTYQENIDSYLSYTKGYKIKDDTYKYFIPLYVQGTIGLEPIKYTIECKIKVGGIIYNLSQDIILIQDYSVAPNGNPIWGLINNSYYQQYKTNYPDIPFYRSITNYITGDISVEGEYNNNGTIVKVKDNISVLQTLIYNNKSILESLPNITGINLNNSSISSEQQEIQKKNINLTNNTKLTKFYIQNCINLTEDIDLSNNPNIAEIDASGTKKINIIIPDTPTKLTKYKLGKPSKISIKNPTILQYNNISVDSGENLEEIELINIPGNKGYTVFNNITI